MNRYRCTYTPETVYGESLMSDSGVLPFVDIEAENAEDAARLAHKQTGCAICEVERQDGPAPRPPRKPRTARRPIVLITGAAMLAALQGCGGGSDDDDRATTQPVTCPASSGVCK